METTALLVMAGGTLWAVSHPQAGKGSSAVPTKTIEAPLSAVPISLRGAQIEGSSSASVALVVYSDFQCPFCGRFARDTMPAIRKEFVDTGRVLIAFRQFPLPNHQNAERAAEASVCAGQQGLFWPFHDQLFGDQQGLDDDGLRLKAQKAGLQPESFDACLKDNRHLAEVVRSDREGGTPLGISGTPSFLVGPLTSEREVKVTERFSGALPLDKFQAVLNRALASDARAIR